MQVIEIRKAKLSAEHPKTLIKLGRKLGTLFRESKPWLFNLYSLSTKHIRGHSDGLQQSICYCGRAKLGRFPYQYKCVPILKSGDRGELNQNTTTRFLEIYQDFRAARRCSHLIVTYLYYTHILPSLDDFDHILKHMFAFLVGERPSSSHAVKSGLCSIRK